MPHNPAWLNPLSLKGTRQGLAMLFVTPCPTPKTAHTIPSNCRLQVEISLELT